MTCCWQHQAITWTYVDCIFCEVLYYNVKFYDLPSYLFTSGLSSITNMIFLSPNSSAHRLANSLSSIERRTRICAMLGWSFLFLRNASCDAKAWRLSNMWSPEDKMRRLLINASRLSLGWPRAGKRPGFFGCLLGPTAERLLRVCTPESNNASCTAYPFVRSGTTSFTGLGLVGCVTPGCSVPCGFGALVILGGAPVPSGFGRIVHPSGLVTPGALVRSGLGAPVRGGFGAPVHPSGLPLNPGGRVTRGLLGGFVIPSSSLFIAVSILGGSVSPVNCSLLGGDVCPGTFGGWGCLGGRVSPVNSLGGPVLGGPAETKLNKHPDSKVHGANMGPTWGRQDPGGPHVGPMNFAIWAYINGLVQERRNSSASAMELRLSCINPLIWKW